MVALSSVLGRRREKRAPEPRAAARGPLALGGHPHPPLRAGSALPDGHRVQRHRRRGGQNGRRPLLGGRSELDLPDPAAFRDRLPSTRRPRRPVALIVIAFDQARRSGRRRRDGLRRGRRGARWRCAWRPTRSWPPTRTRAASRSALVSSAASARAGGAAAGRRGPCASRSGRGTPSAEGPRTSEEVQSFSVSVYDGLPRDPDLLRSLRCRAGLSGGGRGRGSGPRLPPALALQVSFNNPLRAETVDPETITVDPPVPGLRGRCERARPDAARHHRRAHALHPHAAADDRRRLRPDPGPRGAAHLPRRATRPPRLYAPGDDMLVLDPGRPALARPLLDQQPRAGCDDLRRDAGGLGDIPDLPAPLFQPAIPTRRPPCRPAGSSSRTGWRRRASATRSPASPSPSTRR